jgi:hypothetical protein
MAIGGDDRDGVHFREQRIEVGNRAANSVSRGELLGASGHHVGARRELRQALASGFASSLVGIVPTGKEPVGIAVSADRAHQWLYVTSWGPPGTISVVSMGDLLADRASPAAIGALPCQPVLLAGLARAYTTNLQDVLCIGLGVGIVPMIAVPAPGSERI